MARRTKLTPEVQRRICDNIRLGMAYERAAVCAGVGERTFYRWKERAEKAKSGRFRQFWQALQAAETEGEQRHLATIKAAAIGGRETTEVVKEFDPEGNLLKRRVITRQAAPQHTAAAWILERRHPERWARLEKREHTGKGGGNIVVEYTGNIDPGEDL